MNPPDAPALAPPESGIGSPATKPVAQTAPAIFVVGSTSKHCSIRIDHYTRQLELFQQLDGQGYIWELVYGAIRPLVEQGRVHELSGVQDPEYVFVEEAKTGARIERSQDDYKKAIDIATWARIREYFPAGRRAGDGKRGRLRLEGDFLNRSPADNGSVPRGNTWKRAQHFDLMEKGQLDAAGPKLLVVYDDGTKPDAKQKFAFDESLTIVQTDGASNLWFDDETPDGPLARTLFITRSRVFNDAPQRGLGMRTDLSLDTALGDLRKLIEVGSKADDPRAKFFKSFRHLLIRLDSRSTVYLWRQGEKLNYRLFFTPKPRHEIPGGYMLGNTTLLTACLAKQWAEICNEKRCVREWAPDMIDKAVRLGFEYAWRHFDRGFCRWKPDWANPKGFGDWNTWVFDDAPAGEPQTALPGMPIRDIQDSLEEKTRGNVRASLVTLRLGRVAPDATGQLAIDRSRGLRECARDILKSGAVPTLEEHGLPYEEIGEHVLINSAEIDAFSALRSLLRRHMADALATKPFNLAVFGAPGSGKSFGVAQVAASLRREGVAEAGPIIELNLSQFRGAQDLRKAFHRVRNELLGGRVPVVFFDEFDSAPEGEPYGWLKLFLAPMQDGRFLDGESEYNLGRPIFVFAGGTNRSFREMSDRVRSSDFVAAKGPDFISRLRWHVDIAGIDLPEDSAPSDGLQELRRAMLIRTLLEKRGRWRRGDCQMPLDEGLTAAFLEVSKFQHGARSIEAILSMCGGEPGRKLRVMDLPPAELLNMHVDAPEFLQRARQGGATA